MEGYKRGNKDRGHKFNDTVRMPYRSSGFEPSIIPAGHEYKMFYEQGYKWGYEDGYNNTTKYGEVSKNGPQKGYSVRGDVMDSLVNVSD
jgi:hypothetical protein